VLTFTAAQTGTVQIGARRPRRTSQFQESQPVPTRNFNQIFSDIIATQRELWDKTNDITGRSLLGLPGEVFGTLPAAAARANQYFCFSGAGSPSLCASVAGGTNTNNVVTVTGSAPVTTANCGGLLVATGGQNTITLPAASGFGVGCVITLKGRG